MPQLHHCLPRELVDIIFDTLEDDKVTLCACTLLSKCWHLPARQVLFRRIPILWYHETYHATGFLALLNDKTSYIQNLVPCIKELDISCRITERIYEISVTSRGSISAYDVDLLLVKLPALRLLTLTNAKLRHCEEHLTPRCWTSPRPLDELHLVNVYFAMFHQGDYKYLRGCNLVEVLNLFGPVGTLKIFLTSTQMDIGVFFPVEKQVAAEIKEGQRTSQDFRVQKLVSSCYHNREGELFSDQATILNILKNSLALGALQSLSLNDTYESSKETIIAVGRNLKHLTLGLNLPYSLDDVLGTHSSPSSKPELWGISRCTSLTSLQLVVYFPRRADEIIGHWHRKIEMLVDVVSQAPVTVAHLVISFTCEGAILERLAWDKLDELLCGRFDLMSATLEFLDFGDAISSGLTDVDLVARLEEKTALAQGHLPHARAKLGRRLSFR